MPLTVLDRFSVKMTRLDILGALDVQVIPYAVFMIVPILGLMSDSSVDIRTHAAQAFAALVRLLPLEASLVAI